MIYVIATIELIQGKRGDFIHEFRKVVPLVREEKGCLEWCDLLNGLYGLVEQDGPLQETRRISGPGHRRRGRLRMDWSSNPGTGPIQ